MSTDNQNPSNPSEDQVELNNGVATYFPPGSRKAWRAERFEYLQADLSRLTLEDLPTLHEILSGPGNEMSWLIVRRLFGIMPVLIPLNGPSDEYRTWTRAELSHALGKTMGELAEEMASVRLAWERFVKERDKDLGIVSQPDPDPDPVPEPEPERDPDRQDAQQKAEDHGNGEKSPHDELLRQCGFRPDTFEKSGRAAIDNAAEKKWFVSQMMGMRQLLMDIKTGGTARQALENELRLRRASEDLWDLERETPAVEMREQHDKNIQVVGKRIAELQKAHEASIKQLQSLSPGYGISAKETAVTGAIGEIIKGMQEWSARRDSRRLDGINRAYGIQAEMSSSMQVPTPAYRLGKVAYLLESINWLWDPNGKSAFTQKEIAALDYMGREMRMKAQEMFGIRIPDLRAEGLDGEYEEMVKIVP